MFPSKKKSYLSYLRSTPFKETEDNDTYYFHPHESPKEQWVVCLSGETPLVTLVTRSIGIIGKPPRIETHQAEICGSLPELRERVDRLAAVYLNAQADYERQMNKYKEAQIRKAAENFCE